MHISKMFSKEMNERLVELVRTNTEFLFPNSRSKKADQRRINAWAQIADILSKEHPNNCKTPKQVQRRWKNMKQEARDAIQKANNKNDENHRKDVSMQNQFIFNIADFLSDSIKIETEQTDTNILRSEDSQSVTTSPQPLVEQSIKSEAVLDGVLGNVNKRIFQLNSHDDDDYLTRETQHHEISSFISCAKNPRLMTKVELERALLEQKLLNQQKLSTVLDQAGSFFSTVSGYYSTTT